MKCLLVDDDAAIRELLVGYLQQHGIAVEALADGTSFRRCAATADVDLLLLDLMLPDDDGLALCQLIKRQRPALPEHVADRVGELSRLGERAHEDQVYVVRQFRRQVLESRVADQLDVMPFLLAPDGEDLRHDAGEIRVHEPAVQRAGLASGDEVNDPDAESAQGTFPSLWTRRGPRPSLPVSFRAPGRPPCRSP